MKNCYSASTLMIFDLKITDNQVEDKQFVQKYQAVSETGKNIVITHEILHKLSISLENFVFLLLINNTNVIAVNEGEKVTRNARHIDICYHHIWNLIDKKTIKISHISTGEMTV